LRNLTEDGRRVLQKFAHVFFEEGVCEFGSTKIVTHGIEAGNAAAIRKAPIGYLFALRQEMENQMPDLLGEGIIREIDSPWSSPAILVPKKMSGWDTKC
jgi:hypothetical protein